MDRVLMNATREDVEKNEAMHANQHQQQITQGGGVIIAENTSLQQLLESEWLESGTNIVKFTGNTDPLNPRNWKAIKKLRIAALLGIATMISTFTSSIFSVTIAQIIADYNISTEIGTLGVSLYVLGFATGPLVWAPFSELKGRRLPIVLGMFGFTVFEFGAATGQDIQTILICRFFAGFFGASPLTLVGAIYSEVFVPRQLTLAIITYTLTVFAGPFIAPFIGGFIVMNPHLGWRWTQYISGILGTVSFLSLLICLQETYTPVLLVQRATMLRRETGNWAIHAKHEEIRFEWREIANKYLTRPLKMLVMDPIVLILSCFMGYVYGLLYLFLTAYPITFQKIHGMSPGIGGLHYLGLIIGQFFAGLSLYLLQPWYHRKLAQNNGKSEPEWKLPIAIPGSIVFSAGLFWLGWTGYSTSIHWIVPTLSGLLTGYGLLAMFLPPFSYLIETYGIYAASAVAASTFVRSITGAVFPLFATYMFDSLGVKWTGTLLGCVAVLLIPVPIILYRYGKRIRSWSKLGL